MMGGQAYGWFDRDLVNSVKREFEWQKMNTINTLSFLGYIDSISEEDKKIVKSLDTEDLQELSDLVYAEQKIVDNKYNELKAKYRDIFEKLPETLQEKISNLAWVNTEQETLQAMEATIFNLNSMHSRAGEMRARIA